MNQPGHNFKNWHEANEYCQKYDAANLVASSDKFDLAEALLRAYNDGMMATNEMGIQYHDMKIEYDHMVAKVKELKEWITKQ